MDFTLNIYRRLLIILQASGYTFQTFAEFSRNPAAQAVVLRHDIDKLPDNALRMARLEGELGVVGSYYFRIVPAVWDERVMQRIVALGHELGYHYEDLTITRGDHQLAIRHFAEQLARLRRITPVVTACMHGSPLSRHDNRDLWKTYDYRDFGIIAEPYFDVDFHQVFYLTDTGRTWKNTSASLRDRVDSGFALAVTSTRHCIDLAARRQLPAQLMLTIHPQRWHDRRGPWLKELLGQQVKNLLKSGLSAWRSAGG